MKPTNADQEKEQGRMAFWLEPKDIEFLANEWRKIPENVPEHVKQTWERIAFRASSALHKADIKVNPKYPEEYEKYKI